MKIIISNTNCKFLNNIKIILSNQNKYDIYETNKKNIFKLYDTIEPDFIFLSYNDQYHNDIANFLQLDNIKSKVIIENIKHNRLLNDQIYYQMNNKNKIYKIAVLLDNITKIPDHLNDILYPNMINPIVLFNNANIVHPQNLGLLPSEQDKNIILNTYYGCISFDNLYLSEANACGCVHIDGNEDNILEIIKQVLAGSSDKKTIKKNKVKTYQKFLKDIL